MLVPVNNSDCLMYMLNPVHFVPRAFLQRSGLLGLVRRDINLFKAPTRNELIRAYQIAVPEQVEIIIRDGIESGEIKDFNPRLLSRQLVALVEVVQHPYSRSLIGGPPEMAEYVTHLFLDGVAAKN